jgi:hypothetical protein
MGFRSRRRHKGNGNSQQHSGGGGGGGGGSGYHHGETFGLLPGDDVGNRKNLRAVVHPPDDIGNRKDPDEGEWAPDENVGNRIDGAPTHELSGVLFDIAGGRKRRSRAKGPATLERVGKYLIGGVNPLISGGQMRLVPRPEPVLEASDDVEGEAIEGEAPRAPRPQPQHGLNGAPRSQNGASQGMPGALDDEGGGRRRRRDNVDGVAAQEVSERRAQRFFDFDEDDRFEYQLKTTPEQKRRESSDIVERIVYEAGRDATVEAHLIEDGARPKVLVTIAERGPQDKLPPERRAKNAAEPLFIMGNAALMSLNYLVNKIVNRYPDDRIRLAILPKADERLYLDALVEHQKVRRDLPPRVRGPAPLVVPMAAEAPVLAPAIVEAASSFLAHPDVPERVPERAPVVVKAPIVDAPIALPAPVAHVAPIAEAAPAVVEADVEASPKKASRRRRPAAAVEEVSAPVIVEPVVAAPVVVEHVVAAPVVVEHVVAAPVVVAPVVVEPVAAPMVEAVEPLAAKRPRARRAAPAVEVVKVEVVRKPPRKKAEAKLDGGGPGAHDPE